ncbi:histidine kinase [Leifsonia sp. C5G2]|uniref:sensor histidine kinase n=1 Tax=Leifsonia sp. C5G2 TaxID=2735269 RepID=UPI00158491BA|nr:two-component sensor histidine kinase [Leifsonia sp. C5G2]
MNLSVRPTLLSLALTVVGAVAVGYGLVTSHTAQRPVWALAVGLAATGLWVVRSVLARFGQRAAALACAVVMVVAGSFVAAPTNGISVVPAAVGIVVLLADVTYPLWLGFGLSAVGLALIPVGAVAVESSVPAVLAEMGGLVLAVFAGLSRRQFRRAEEQAALLRERDLTLREEESRVAIARDLHDVLAHSLGGLVIQLDAVDALLESGDAAAARTRVQDARALAADGLADARRAVAALREPAEGSRTPVAPSDLEAELRELVDAHRALGGEAELSVHGSSSVLDSAQATAVRRALQEALSNARKHAPGAAVAARLDWQTDRVRLTVSNPIVSGRSALSSSGGGHGLDGMRERFAALAGGGAATASVSGGRFTVTAEAVLR